MRIPENEKAFEAELSKIVGLTCWGAIAGKGTGSMVTLDYGRKIPIVPPLRNDRLSKVLREYHGEYCIFIEGCAWRLESKRTILCGWGDDADKIGECVQCLVGCRLSAASVTNWALDLNLSFSNDYVLRLFCDQTAGTLDNYSLRSPSGWYSVGPNSKISQEAG
jgi:hypothetical protein